jgi:leader peptidase (prepilin peptidase) / N-methyltransferase
MSDWLMSPFLLLPGIGLLGVMVGHLINNISYLLPRILEAQWRQEAREILGLNSASSSATEDRSQGISKRRIQAVQFGCAALSIVTVWQLGTTLQALFALLLGWWLLTLSLIDLKHYLLPDSLVLPGIWFGLILNALDVFTTLHAALWGCVVAYLALWTVNQLVQRITGTQALGNGDFKLLAMLGAWGGWHSLPITVLFALLFAVLANIPTWLKPKTRPTTIPFGPHLSIAGWACVTFQLNQTLTN